MFAIRTTEAEESGRVQRRMKGNGKGHNASGDEGAAKTVIKKSVRDKTVKAEGAKGNGKERNESSDNEAAKPQQRDGEEHRTMHHKDDTMPSLSHNSSSPYLGD